MSTLLYANSRQESYIDSESRSCPNLALGGKHVGTTATSFALILLTVIGVIPSLMAQEPPAPPAGPLPAQIQSASKVFISNAGEDTWLNFDPKHNPNLTYDAFYAAMKTWGKYQLVSSPAEADLVFEIHFGLREERAEP